VERVGIIGGGQMGAGIAEVCAKAGVDVVVREVTQELAAAGEARIQKSLDRAVSRGKLEQADAEAAMGRIRFTTDLALMADRELVIEAIVEHEGLKVATFEELDGIVADDTIVASNTSSLPITRLSAAMSNPSRFLGLHFFNPVPVMALVEVVETLILDPEVAAKAEAFVTDVLGKTVIRSKDRAGFIVNMLLVPYLTEAIRMFEQGFASKEDIDTGMRLGANHPMGPLQLCDYIGLDTMKLVADVLFEEFKSPQYAPPPLLARMVEAGLLGRKSGRGFYDYS
jgi:3-hydroxybutyryl-CoA dehydrogenase